jgi:hypothetical protein
MVEEVSPIAIVGKVLRSFMKIWGKLQKVFL